MSIRTLFSTFTDCIGRGTKLLVACSDPRDRTVIIFFFPGTRACTTNRGAVVVTSPALTLTRQVNAQNILEEEEMVVHLSQSTSISRGKLESLSRSTGGRSLLAFTTLLSFTREPQSVDPICSFTDAHDKTKLLLLLHTCSWSPCGRQAPCNPRRPGHDPGTGTVMVKTNKATTSRPGLASVHESQCKSSAYLIRPGAFITCGGIAQVCCALHAIGVTSTHLPRHTAVLCTVVR